MVVRRTTARRVLARGAILNDKQDNSGEEGSYLFSNPAIRDVMTRINLTDMDDDTQQVVRATPAELVVLFSVVAPAAVSVGQHVQLERKLDRRVDLGGFVVTALFILESLSRGVSMARAWREHGESDGPDSKTNTK